MKTKSKRQSLTAVWAVLIAAMVLALPGCATHDSRAHVKSVAKDWCETIRASQVVPVYPLTQDVVVGDVYLVQSSIADQTKDYEHNGFLALDDHQVRLPYTNFSNLYFDGYFQDQFGKTPHSSQTFTNVPAGGGTVSNYLTSITAPRVAFPTYSFQAQSGFGLSAAFPIQGVPVALGFLGTDQVNGSVSIVDAYTYAGDEDTLIGQLQTWSLNPAVRKRLAATAFGTWPTPVYLRVVSRVYIARAFEVSLQKASAQGGSAKAGNVNSLSLMTTNGTINPNYTNVLSALNNSQTSLAGMVGSAAQVGGSATFVSASSSSVGLSQSFDRLLTVGYLGFDLQVMTNGDLSATPIPTFLHLNGKIKEARPVDVVGLLTADQAGFQVNILALKSLVKDKPASSLGMMLDIVKNLDSPPEFKAVFSQLQAADPATISDTVILKLFSEFQKASINYVSVEGGSGEPYSKYAGAFNQAYSQTQ